MRRRISLKGKYDGNLKQHLIRCEIAMQSAKPILGKSQLSDRCPDSTVIGFVSVLIEHQEAIRILVMTAYQALHLRSSTNC